MEELLEICRPDWQFANKMVFVDRPVRRNLSKINKITGRWILDSRAIPTVEAVIFFDSGATARASVPSGASTGVHEAHELRDGGSEFSGKGVSRAVENINSIISATIIGKDFDQKSLDELLINLDGTPDKSKLGANAILAVSLAFSKAQAIEKNIPLYRHLSEIANSKIEYMPCPEMNVINGGAHASNNLDFQEFIILPIGFETLEESITAGVQTYQSLKTLLANKGLSVGLGDEGGFAPNCDHTKIVLNYLIDAIKSAGYEPGKQIFLGLDVAASAFFQKTIYHLKNENKTLTCDGMIGYMKALTNDYPFSLIEDPLGEDDIEGWKKATIQLDNVALVGDDLFVTNLERLKFGIENRLANTILIKPNQIGTLSETLQVIEEAKNNNYNYIISHRSGETEDTFISHMAVATNALAIKSGAPARGERTAKYNELLRINSQLSNIEFSGRGRWKMLQS